MKFTIKYFLVVLALFLAALACSFSSGEEVTDPNPNSADQISMQATERAIQATQMMLADQTSQQDQGNGTEPKPQEDTQTQIDGGSSAIQAGAEGALLAYDAAIAGQMSAELVPAVQDGAYQVAHPRHVQFNLMGGQGVVSMVPVRRYALVYSEAEQMISSLQVAIGNLPAAGASCVPELPLRDFFHVCSHQEFVASPAYLDFVNGSGIRFVTVYAIQDLAPVDNDNLRYIFQGLTSDGQCYLSIEFGITHTSLPGTGEIPIDVYTDMEGDLSENYFGGIAEQLTQNQAGYSTALSLLDEFVQSLQVIQCGVNE